MRSCRNKKKNGDDDNGNLTLDVQLTKLKFVCYNYKLVCV